MADNFSAEKVSSADQIFATDQRASDSAHFAIGKIAWGALNTFNITSTSSPFPVQLLDTDSSQPVFVTNNSAEQLFVQADSNNAVFVTDKNSTTVTVTNIAGNDTVFTQTGYSTQVTAILSSGGSSLGPVYAEGASATAITGIPMLIETAADNKLQAVSSASPMFVTLSDTNITVTNIAGNDTTVTVTNIADNDTVVTVTGSSVVVLNTSSAVAGAALSTQLSLSSVAATVTTAATRLYGYSFFNPDTAANVWVKIFQDDSGGVTLGTTEPAMNLMIPFGGGLNLTIPQGINMSSGLSIAAAAGAGSTVHDAPATTVFASLVYTPST